MNYFSNRYTAYRYSNGRPDFHAQTIERIKKFLNLQNKLDSALDIACGTGLSTKALLTIANDVYGTDCSQHMLDHAVETEKIKYSLAFSDEQPFDNNTFDLITVCSGIHWFDIDKFFQETSRLLKNYAWLVVYDNFFISEMVNNVQFRDWFPNVYLKKYPSPSRNDNYDWANEILTKMHLNLVAEEKYTNSVVFNKSQLALYFTTQSNIISQVEKSKTTYEAVESWLDNELSLFFDSDDATQTINFGNWIKFIHRVSDP